MAINNKQRNRRLIDLLPGADTYDCAIHLSRYEVLTHLVQTKIVPDLLRGYPHKVTKTQHMMT
jgi:hypothetical protein